MIKKLEMIIFGLSALGMLWILASWVEVALFNLDPEHIYSSWNLFTFFIR